jgi:paraquat-inducible protein B
MNVTKPLVVGSFVVGGLALAVLAIVFFGGIQLFAHELPIVVVFQHSIAGLEVGAPVTFRGVRVGRVEGMKLHIDVHHHESWIPVYLGLDLDQVSWNDGAVGTRADLKGAVAGGLRAQLVSQGLVSGQLSVNLDYHPGTPAALTGRDDHVEEIPTVPSDLQTLKDEFQRLDLVELTAQTRQVLTSMQRLLDDVDKKVGPLTDQLQATLVSNTQSIQALEHGALQTVGDVDRLAVDARAQLKINGDELDQLMKAAELTTREADSLVVALNDMTSNRGDLQASLRDLAASASSLRSLTHDLERNPVGTLMRKDQR